LVVHLIQNNNANAKMTDLAWFTFCNISMQLLYYAAFTLKGVLNPNFLNLTMNREKLCSRYVLVLFF